MTGAAPKTTFAPVQGQQRRTTTVAFVGQAVFFAQCIPTVEVPGYAFFFRDFRSGADPGPLRQWLEQLSPDVIVMFRPEIVPSGAFEGLDAVRIGYLTEPLPRPGAAAPHPDLLQRLRWLEAIDRRNFDLVVCFDPLIADTASRIVPVWRCQPLPVADFLFGEAQSIEGNEPALLIGRPTPAREAWLAELRPDRAIVHIGHGLHGERLAAILKRHPIHLNLHNNPYPTFENRVSIALAAGELVISEPLSPDHGLKDGSELLIANNPAELRAISEQIRIEPQHFEAVARAGRSAAERLRASVVFARLVAEALAER